MEFSIKKTSFNNALKDVLRAISSKTTIPILTNVKIELTETNLILTGSNADISIEIFISKENEQTGLVITETGGITLPANLFSTIVSKLSTEDLHIKTQDTKALITSGKTSYTLNGQDIQNYPKLPVIENAKQITVSASQFIDVIKQTTLSASDQETRPLLTGIHAIFEGNMIKAVATDSHRLSQRITALSAENTDLSADVIIPAKALEELAKMLENKQTVAIQVLANQIIFSWEGATFYTNLMEGRYPETDRLIPDEATTTLTINVATLQGALSRVSILSHQSRNNVITLSMQNNMAKLTGKSQEIGQVIEDLTDVTVTGEPLEISFNPDYVMNALRAFNVSDEVDLKFTLDLKPFTITEVGAIDKSKIQLITPVRTI